MATQYHRQLGGLGEGLLMVIPRQYGLADEGIAANIAVELAEIEDQIRVFSGIDDDLVATLKGYIKVVTKSD